VSNILDQIERLETDFTEDTEWNSLTDSTQSDFATWLDEDNLRKENLMSTVPQTLMTEEQYLAFERASEIRHEYWRGEIFAMAGASEGHNLAAGNLFVAMQLALRDKPCRTYTHDMRVFAAKSRAYVYPDIVVAWPPIEFNDGKRDTLLNPQVVIEVLSPSTESYDRGRKFDLYRQSESLKQYVLVSQDEARVMSYIRQSHGCSLRSQDSKRCWNFRLSA
jgi:Uma2 family endonuclease